MNLAIHDFRELQALHLAGETQSWAQRQVRAWSTPGMFRGRPPHLQAEVPLELLNLSEPEQSMFQIFYERLRRRCTYREAQMLYLAEQNQSAILTGEPMVAEEAQALGVRVCSRETLGRFFPLATASAESIRVPVDSGFSNSTICTEKIVQDLRNQLPPVQFHPPGECQERMNPFPLHAPPPAAGRRLPALVVKEAQRNP